jgi:hypothetical protein
MAQKRRFTQNKRQRGSSPNPELRGLRRPPEVTERVAPTVYGKPFIVLEDESKNTFTFKAGAWIPNEASIADFKQTCQVKELAQKVNRMTRYEVRAPQEA